MNRWRWVMGIGVSLFLLATGAILAWAVTYETTGVDINAVGVMLMIVVRLVMLFSLLYRGTLGFGPYFGARLDEVNTTTVVHDRDLPPTTVVRDRDLPPHTHAR